MVVLDAFSRRVVGWHMADHLQTELVRKALDMAIWNRRPEEGVVHHSDPGSQYTSLDFGRRCWEPGIVASYGQLATPTTMPSASHSSPRWSANSWTADGSV